MQNNHPSAYANLSFGGDATLDSGMRLASAGGGILLDNNVPTSAIFIIGSAANSQITVIAA